MQQSVERHRLAGASFPQQQISPRRLRRVRLGYQVFYLQKRSTDHERGFVDGLDLVSKSGFDSPLEELIEFVRRQRVKQANIVLVESHGICL